MKKIILAIILVINLMIPTSAFALSQNFSEQDSAQPLKVRAYKTVGEDDDKSFLERNLALVIITGLTLAGVVGFIVLVVRVRNKFTEEEKR